MKLMKAPLLLASVLACNVAFAGSVKVSWQTLKLGGKAEVEARYPSFKGNELAQLASAGVRNRVQEVVAEYRKEWGNGNGTDRPSGMYISGTVTLNQASLISAFTDFAPYTGGAHGGLFYSTHNYGVVNGRAKKLKLKDLFQPGVKFRDVLSPLILQSLREREAGWVENGDYRDISELVFDSFVITPQGLTFIVPPYEAGSWAEGTFWVKVPFKEIVDVLAKNGPLKGLKSAFHG